MSSNLEKLQLLSWKYLHLRKYHWIMSLMEICLPILLVYLIIKLGQQFIDFQLTREPVIIFPENTQKKLLTTLHNYDVVYYTPLTNLTERIMHEFSAVINGENITVMPIVTEVALTEKISQSKENIIGIVFIEFSNLIKFKIRDRNEWHLDKSFVENEKQISGPYMKDPYFNTGYAAALFVTELASVRVMCEEFNITRPSLPFNLHAFPYPEYTKSSPLRGLVPMLMGFVVVLTSLILCGSLLVNIIAEKESKLKELMKVAGIQEWLLWLSWFFNSLMISLVVYTTVTFLLQHDFYGPNTAAIYFVHPTILWTWIILYYVSNISFCFFFCAAFNSTTIATVSFFMTTFVISYAAFKVHEWRNSTLIHICCLFPVGAFIGGFIRITYYEMLASPLTWRSLFLSEISATDASLGFVFIAFIFDTFLYLFLTYFINNINPGRFGFKKFILYLLKGEDNKIPPFEMKKTIGNAENQQKYFEEVLPNAEPSIELENLQKNFGNEYVVKGVNLIIYRSEILVLLGPNGAGKTTTLLMMTGLSEPTYGSVFYRDSEESSRRTKLIKKNLGYCPQEDRLFPYFSVMNHLLFFGMLKGATIQTAQQEADQYLRLMELHTRSSDLSSTLSAGMRRNLCLAVALMGKSEILVLDEPTSGMDLESRRKVWNILLELRKNRTIILTTHHIEEADALGSRIAIMNHGIIKCCGSPIFLKKVYGTGYQLKIIRKQTSTRKQKNVFPQILHLINKNIPEARVEHQTLYELEVTLPLATTNKFPVLFKSLEAKKKVLNIAHIEVSCTTMEQVFLKAGIDKYRVRKKSKRITKFLPKSKLSADEHEKSTKGIWYIVSQCKTLIFKKKMLYMKRNSVIFFCHIKSTKYYDIDVDDHSPLTTIWFIMLGFFTVDLLNYFSMAVRVEHIDGFKHVQLVSGVSPSTYWISTLMFDSSIFLLVVLCRLFLFKHFDDYNFFASYSHIFLLIYLMFLFSFSGLLFIYIIINFYTGSKGGSYIIFLIFNIISTAITFSYYQFETAHLEGSYDSTVGKWILFLMKYIILLVPPFNFSLTLEKYVMAWRVNYLLGPTHDSNIQQTGLEEKFEKYLEFSSRQNPNGMLQEIIFLGIDIILYAGLLYTIEQGHIGKLLLSVKIRTKEDQNENNKSEIDDEDVILERKEVAKLIENIKSDSSSNALIAQNLKKIYVNVFKSPVTAVVDVTFKVQMGECFGLLGLNGAGKTTTFKMLTGEIIPTEGNSWLLNISLKENKTEYSSICGYCAENYAVLEELTGRELLTLVASLRGLSESDRDKAVEKWISKLGLEMIQNNNCSTYSGGEKRKISIALSLIGDPRVIFLDEPTRGADPISRRKLYDIINQSKYSGQAIVMSSHSVQESEILCDRITILCQGAMKCISSPHHLKEKYAQGYTISIKVRDLSELDMIHKLPELKEAITSEFKPGTYTLKEESKGWLYCQIKDRTLLWSEIFSKMERLKTKQDILAEYIITETSLEEVFLAFARPT